jgi:hypothetical protein
VCHQIGGVVGAGVAAGAVSLFIWDIPMVGSDSGALMYLPAVEAVTDKSDQDHNFGSGFRSMMWALGESST